jgi:copper chaperone CopZ
MRSFPPSPAVWSKTSHTWVLALSALLIGGCSECDVDIVHSDRAGHSEETVAQLAISGMMCEIACVSKVRKELYDVQGVAHADIHFDKDLSVDTAFVAYDPALVQPEDLIATVQEIGDGLYAVQSAEVIHYAPESHR